MIPFRNRCCNGCEEPVRHIGCHSDCELFLAEQEEFERLKAEIEAAKQADRVYDSYHRGRMQKWVKLKRHKERKDWL